MLGNNVSIRKVSRLLPCLAAAALLTTAAMAGTVTSVTSPTNNWTVVPTIDLDPGKDQQTGQTDADLVGIVADPGFYTGFDGTNIYFRVRLGSVSDSHTNAFKNTFWIGIDANGDGALDLFIGVDNQGSTTSIGFFAPGTGANNSPSTTTIQNANPTYQIAETATNYNYQLVNNTLDPTLTNADLDADGNTDVFLSIAVPFFGASGTATLQGALAGLASLSVTQNTGFSYITATSTQTNSLNQDIGGINGQVNSSLTYQQLGAISPKITGSGVVIPEPGSISYMGLSLALLAFGLGRIRPCR